MPEPPVSSAALSAIPGKRYFTIGEVSALCGVKAHVLRYWEQEFPGLEPLKGRTDADKKANRVDCQSPGRGWGTPEGTE